MIIRYSRTNTTQFTMASFQYQYEADDYSNWTDERLLHAIENRLDMSERELPSRINAERYWRIMLHPRQLPIPASPRSQPPVPTDAPPLQSLRPTLAQITPNVIGKRKRVDADAKEGAGEDKTVVTSRARLQNQEVMPDQRMPFPKILSSSPFLVQMICLDRSVVHIHQSNVMMLPVAEGGLILNPFSWIDGTVFHLEA